MAIYCVTGKPRHGKTYWLAKLFSKKLNNGERVFSNLKLNLGVGALKKLDESIVGDLYKKEDRDNPQKLLFYWRNLHEWNHFSNGSVLCDEMTRYFNPRQWTQLSEETEIKLQQHGKEDLDIWGTTQHYTRIDLTMRVLVEKFFIVETTWGKPNNQKSMFGKRIKVVGLDLEEMDLYYRLKLQPELADQYELDFDVYKMWFRKKYAVIYDTRQSVGRSESMPLVHKSRVCEICGEEKITHT